MVNARACCNAMHQHQHPTAPSDGGSLVTRPCQSRQLAKSTTGVLRQALTRDKVSFEFQVGIHARGDVIMIMCNLHHCWVFAAAAVAYAVHVHSIAQKLPSNFWRFYVFFDMSRESKESCSGWRENKRKQKGKT